MNKSKGESLKLTRLMMVLSGFNILFLLWAITGAEVLKEYKWVFTCKGAEKIVTPYLSFQIICFLMIIIPWGLLRRREKTARKNKDIRKLTIIKAQDHREHLLVYLLAVLLPLWASNMAEIRTFISTIIALLFIVFVFYNLRLHYINIIYAIRGYKIYTIFPADSDNAFSGKTSFVLITPRDYIDKIEDLKCYRISDTVYMESKEDS